MSSASKRTAPPPSGRTVRGAKRLERIRGISQASGAKVSELVDGMRGYEPEVHREVQAEIEAGG